MRSIFAETMNKAIGSYRQLLRKYLPQAERVSKLSQLNLKNPQLYESDALLYQTGHKIVEDIRNNLSPDNNSYYAYSGVAQFGEYLSEFLANYEQEGNQVIHRAQKASRALVQAIQLLNLPKEKLNNDVARQLGKLNLVIANYGSPEQQELHKTTLQNTIRRMQEQNTAFYRSVLHNFQQHLQPDEAQSA